ESELTDIARIDLRQGAETLLAVIAPVRHPLTRILGRVGRQQALRVDGGSAPGDLAACENGYRREDRGTERRNDLTTHVMETPSRAPCAPGSTLPKPGACCRNLVHKGPTGGRG